MAINDDTSEIAKQVAALPGQWQAWAQAQVDGAVTAALAAQAQAHKAELEALRQEMLQDHADEITALQTALAQAAPPPAAK